MRQSIAAATSHAHRSIGIGIISSKYRGKKEGKNEADKKNQHRPKSRNSNQCFSVRVFYQLKT